MAASTTAIRAAWPTSLSACRAPRDQRAAARGGDLERGGGRSPCDARPRPRALPAPAPLGGGGVPVLRGRRQTSRRSLRPGSASASWATAPSRCARARSSSTGCACTGSPCHGARGSPSGCRTSASSTSRSRAPTASGTTPTPSRRPPTAARSSATACATSCPSGRLERSPTWSSCAATSRRSSSTARPRSSGCFSAPLIPGEHGTLRSVTAAGDSPTSAKPRVVVAGGGVAGP